MINCDKTCGDVEIIKHFQTVKTAQKDAIRMIMISESFPKNPDDYFDGDKNPVFIKNTNYLFNQNGCDYSIYDDYLNNGIYLTTAIKCVKKDYLVSAETIEMCSYCLEKELEEFPDTKVLLLMGDFAIKAVNYIWKRKYNVKPIPNGSTYKIRNAEYKDRGIHFIPSYTQTGDSFGIEKGKIEMMKEDVGKALKILKN
jgi:uracil-DNA glycosylase